MPRRMSAAWVWDVASVSVIACFVYPLVRLAESGSPDDAAFYALFLVGIALADASTGVLKRLTAPLGVDALLRPAGASGCDLLCADGDASGAPGFPSGHATTAAFFATLVYLRTPSVWTAALGIAYVLLVCVARAKKRCHNPLQLVAGCVYGGALAFLVFRLHASAVVWNRGTH